MKIYKFHQVWGFYGKTTFISELFSLFSGKMIFEIVF